MHFYYAEALYFLNILHIMKKSKEYVHTLYKYIPIGGSDETKEKWEGIGDSLWNGETHPSV